VVTRRFFFVGYHAQAGKSNSNMNYTYNPQTIRQIMINDRVVNESVMNAALAGYHEVPVGLIIGDDTLEAEINETGLFEGIQYVTTKQSIGRFSAIHRPYDRLQRDTIEKVKAVLASDLDLLPLVQFTSPITLKMTFKESHMAEFAALLPRIERIAPDTISYTDEDYSEIYDCIEGLTFLARSVAKSDH